jgi:hypothetical protein
MVILNQKLQSMADRLKSAIHQAKIWRLRRRCAELRNALVDLPNEVRSAKIESSSRHEANLRHINHRAEVLRLQYQHEYNETARMLAEME